MSEDDDRAAEGMARARGGRGAVVAAVVTGGAMIAAGWWALGPLGDDEIRAEVETTIEAAGPRPQLASLDEAAFRAPLWIAAPAPPKAPPRVESKPEPSVPPPLNLVVLAIARDVKGARALIYDLHTNKPDWVEAGQMLGPRTVEAIDDDRIVVRDGTLSRSLSLRDVPGAGTAIERALIGTGGTR